MDDVPPIEDDALAEFTAEAASCMKAGVMSCGTTELRALLARLDRAEARGAWRAVDDEAKSGAIVIVPGGVARWEDGRWMSLTGNDWPGRPIEWAVKWWQPLPEPPRAGEGGL